MLNSIAISDLASSADYETFLQQRAAHIALALANQDIAVLETIAALDRENLQYLKNDYQRLGQCLRNTVKIACYEVD